MEAFEWWRFDPDAAELHARRIDAAANLNQFQVGRDSIGRFLMNAMHASGGYPWTAWCA